MQIGLFQHVILFQIYIFVFWITYLICRLLGNMVVGQHEPNFNSQQHC